MFQVLCQELFLPWFLQLMLDIVVIHLIKNEMNKKVCGKESLYGYQMDSVVS